MKDKIEANRERRHQRMSKNDQTVVLCAPIDRNSSELSSMSPLDWTQIHQIQLAYTEGIGMNQVTGVPLYPATQAIYSTLDLLRIPTYLASIRLIAFLKQIPEFDSFDAEDRVTLVKHNLLAVVLTHTVLLYDPLADTYHEYNTADPIFRGQDWIDILGEEFYHALTRLATTLIEIVHYDRVIIKVFLFLILTSKGFCAYDIAHEPSLNNYPLVISTHYAYLTSLYNYCLQHYGPNKTLLLFTRSLGQLLAVQRLAVHLKDFVHDHVDTSQLSPLLQSVLQLAD
jgi:hypothetical protein